MKIKHLLIGLFAVAATVACKQDELVETPSLEVSQESLELTATEAEASFDVTSNVAWTATADQDWVSLDPASGDASKKAVAVTVTAEDNTATEARTATVTVKAGDLTKTVALTQAAAEAEDPGTNPTVPEVTELYMLGQACDTGWAIDQMTAFELVDGLWVWEGNLKPDDGEGDSEVFCFMPQKVSGQWWPRFIPNADATAVTYTEEEIPNTYQVESDGYYKITVDPVTLAMTIERLSDRQAFVPQVTELYVLGDAVDTGWSLDHMPAFENNNGVFTWTGHLKANARYRFPMQRNYWPCLCATTDGSTVNYGINDPDETHYPIPQAGVWTITINLTNWASRSISFELVEADPETEPSYTVAGTFVSAEGYWKEAGAAGLMALEGDYYVAKGLDFKWRSSCYDDSANENWFEFKVVETGTWNGVGASGEHVANTAIDVTWGGGNINLHSPEGVYDVYFDEANLKVWVMKAGYAPGDEVPEDEQPEQPTITYVVAGTIDGDKWNNAGEKGRMTLEGDYYVAKNLTFATSHELYGDNKNFIEFKILHFGTWDCYGQVEAGNKSANTEIAVKWGGDNIAVAAPAGNYDVYFDKTNLKVWFMKSGYAPGDEVPEDEQPEEPQNPDYQVSELYMLGPGSDVGWNLGLITPFKKVDDVWVWEGNLYPNEQFRFQLAKDNQWAPSLTPSNDGKSVYRTEGQNSDYCVESAGFYKVTVNPLTGALDVEKLGDSRAKSLIYELFLIGTAVPAHGGEWLLQKDHPFTNVDGVFTWEGELVPGSIRPVPHVFDWKPTIQKKTDTELELVYDYSTSDITIAEAGKYTLVINAKDSDNITYTLTKHEEPKPEPVLTLAANEASVAADATSYEVALTANCAWTAIASEGVTVDPANGEGDAAVTLAFAANEVTSPVTHTVTFSAGEDVTAVLTLTQAAAIPVGISSIKDKITSATEVAFTAKLEDAIVTYVNGKNAYIQDADAGILIYQDGHGLVAGNKINGVISGKATSYNNLREITSVDLSSATIESGAEIPVTEITVADLLADGGYDKYESMRVKVVNVEVIIANSKVAQGENSCDLYMKNKSAVGYDQYSLVTVTAYPGKYNSTIQLNVWEDAEFLGISRTVLTGFGDIEVPVGEKKANKATASSGATVVYTSSSESVASVDQDGNVTGVAEGTATVTVRVDAYNGYPAAEATYKVTVLPAGTEVAKAWTLVTNVSALAAGDKIIIVATNTNQALSEVQNTNNRGQVAVAKSDNTVTFDTAVQEITLEAGTVDGTFAFNVGESNYLYAASSSNNYLKTGTKKNENASWKIEIASSGVATVKAQGTNTRNWLRHNSTNGLFACYSSGQNDVSIYKYQ